MRFSFLCGLLALSLVGCKGDSGPGAEAASWVEFTISGALAGGDAGTTRFTRPHRDYVGDNDQNAVFLDMPSDNAADKTIYGHLVGDESQLERRKGTVFNALRMTIPGRAVGTYAFNGNDTMWAEITTRSGFTYKAGRHAAPFPEKYNRTFSVTITESGDRVKGSFSYFPMVYQADGSFDQEHSNQVAINGRFDLFYWSK